MEQFDLGKTKKIYKSLFFSSCVMPNIQYTDRRMANDISDSTQNAELSMKV